MNPGEASACWLWQGDTFEQSAGLPLSDRGFRYGMSVFETVRIHMGLPVFWNEHLARLTASAATCGFPLSESALQRSISLISPLWTEGVLRLYVTAGDGPPSGPAVQTRIAVLWEGRARQLPPSYALETTPGPHLPLLGGLKTGNYWANAQSLGEAKSHGADEALLFTPDNHLIGGCMANAFVHIGGVWLTPPKSLGAREGVVRQWVLEHFPVIETSVSRAEISRADAVFLTSSWIGVMPARQLDQRMIGVPDQVLRLRQMLEAEMEKTDHTEPTEAIV